ncbi:calcyclin-binding protein-like [Uloborus diversus]|uniref:calcyclin-binding protein-like n=1 Tax=Uloborus diversus TaxID=327109 RepID=UPI0024093393|nr:calcyclin-binding protein-like [Uloborus diversus]XP_054713981.1 calcyclin-binding protein-like [Uloborus diversus]XP_054713982.1 calcyclin-binding protein-like [Uloborus diversus]
MSLSLRKDAEELARLSQLTNSENVRRILTVEGDKLMKLAEAEEKAASNKSPEQRSSVPLKPSSYTAKMTNYAWDQSDKYLKIYLTIPAVHTFPTENVTSSFSTRSVELQALAPEGKNNVFQIKNLLNDILPSESYSKVKTDMVVLYLRKVTAQHWGYVTESEKKAKEPKSPKVDKDEDPSQSLMTLMKQMYEDGDDEMKRTIAKAWTEARDKQTDDIPM